MSYDTLLSIHANARFPMGELVITANAAECLRHEAIAEALDRYSKCDWGELCREDIEQNQHALTNGSRLFAAYGQGAGRFWIITEADRSVTTILLPQDY